MAKYIMIQNQGMFTYSLDECEDYLVLDAFLAIKESGRYANEKNIKRFEYYHIEEGGTLNDNILMSLNGYLRNIGKKQLLFVNGHTTAYAHLRGADKVKRREKMLEYLRSITPEARDSFISKKEAEAAGLPERDPEHCIRPTPTPGELSRNEIERRRAAVANAQKADARQAQVGKQKLSASPPVSTTAIEQEKTGDQEPEFVPESTVQDNVVELIMEMHDLKKEVASLKAMLQNIFKNV